MKEVGIVKKKTQEKEEVKQKNKKKVECGEGHFARSNGSDLKWNKKRI